MFTDFCRHGKAYNGGRWKSRVTRVMDVEWNTHVEAACNPFFRWVQGELCRLSVCLKLEIFDALYSFGIMSRSLSKA
jgi:hypothetical protein